MEKIHGEILGDDKTKEILKKRDKIVRIILIFLGLIFLVQALGFVKIIGVEKVWGILGIDKWGVVTFYILIAIILLALFIVAFLYYLFLTLLNLEKIFLKKPGRNIVKITNFFQESKEKLVRALTSKMNIVIKLFLAFVFYFVMQYLFSITKICKNFTSISFGEQTYIDSCLTQQQTIFLIASLICFVFAFLPKEIFKDYEAKKT